MKNNVIYVDFKGTHEKKNSMLDSLLEMIYKLFHFSKKSQKPKIENYNHKHIL